MRIFRLKKLKNQAGFSLLEMLIVLAIMGLVLSLVGVRMVSSIEASRFARTADGGIAKIRSIRAEALLDNRALLVMTGNISAPQRQRFKPDQRRTLELPAGWTVTGSPIAISKTGFCSGGRITLRGPSGRQAHYDLQAPACLPERSI